MILGRILGKTLTSTSVPSRSSKISIGDLVFIDHHNPEEPSSGPQSSNDSHDYASSGLAEDLVKERFEGELDLDHGAKQAKNSTWIRSPLPRLQGLAFFGAPTELTSGNDFTICTLISFSGNDKNLLAPLYGLRNQDISTVLASFI